MEVIEDGLCPEHTKKKLNFYCLSTTCSKRPLACVICI